MKKISLILMTIAICFGIVNAVRAKRSGLYDELYKDKPIAKVYHSETPEVLVSNNSETNQNLEPVQDNTIEKQVPEKTIVETYKIQREETRMNKVKIESPLVSIQTAAPEAQTIAEANANSPSDIDKVSAIDSIPVMAETDSVDNSIQFDTELFSRAIPQHHVKKKKHNQEDIGMAMKEMKK